MTPEPPSVLLYVGADPACREETARALRGAGFGVHEAANAAEALRDVREPPDLILLDCHQRDRDGRDFCQQITADPRTAAVPLVVITTAGAPREVQNPNLEYGADLYLESGTAPPVLVASLRSLLRLRRLEQQLREAEEQLRLATEAEAVAEKAQERFRAVFEYSQDAVLFADDAARYVDANPAACRLTGYSRDELLRMTIWDLTPAADRSAGLRLWEDFLAAGRHSGEYQIQAKDGRRVVVDTQAVAGVLPGHHLAVLRDVTARREAEEALRQSEERFRQLAENLSELVWLAEEPDGPVIYVNPAYRRIFGRDPQEALADRRAWLTAVHPEDRPRIETARPQLATGTYDVEFRVLRADGSVAWMRARAFPIRDESGTVRRIAGIAEDITHWKQGEDLKTALLETVSHDLRTPLSTILASAATLRRLAPPDGPLRGAVTVIESEATRLDGVVSGLLDLSRLEVGEWKPAREWNDLWDLVAAVLGQLPAEEADRVRTRLPEAPVLVNVDGAQVVRALWNLVDNALKYSPRDREVVLAGALQDATLRISVRDEGPGIPPSEQQRIFGRFYRGPESAKIGIPGTGVGLAICHGLVAANGGRIWVESDGVQGATFTIELPAGPEVE